MEIDSLVISLGLDPSKLRQGLNQVLAALQQTMPQAADFLQGLVAGMAEALNEAGDTAQQGVREVGGASEAMVQQFNEAVNRFSEGVDKLGQKTQQVAARARQAGGEMQSLGRKWGGFLGGMAARFAAPLAGALSAGAMVGGYMRDVAQMAQMTGRSTTQMEEWRKKRELLSRITREDVELYRKGKLALLDFSFAMASLSTTIMRALSPAIQGGIRLLHAVADWVRRNEPNIIRFVTVLAGTITAVLVPAFIKLAIAMLANPLTWIIAGILLLAFVIDDLVTYIRGGDSALADLWSQFGTGEEIARALGEAWEWLKSVGETLFADLLKVGKAFIANFGDAFEGLKEVVQGVINFIKAVFSGKWEDAGKAVRQIFKGLFKEILGTFNGIIKTIEDAIQKLLGMIPSWDSIKSGAASTWEGIKDFSKGLWGGDEKETSTALGDSFMIPPVGAMGPQLMAAGVSAGAGTQTTNVRNDTQIGPVNITTQATDAEGIARDMQGQLEKQAAGLNFQAANAGMRY